MEEKNHPNQLIAPYGGKLVNLLVSDEERQELLSRSSRLPSVQISPRACVTWSCWRRAGSRP
jgi:hypothetical protein